MQFFRKMAKARQEKGKKKKKYLEIWANMYKIRKYFEKGQVIVCDYPMQ